MKLSKLFIFTIAAVLFAAGGNAAYADNKELKYEGSMKAIPHSIITFDQGSAALTEADRESLRKLVVDTKAKGEINEVTVAAWSDKSLPRRGQKLPDADRTLADQRAMAISNFLKNEMLVEDVETYNMAEGSHWLARTFGTAEAELKSIFGRKGAEVPVTNAEFHLIKNEGGPSEAVVVIERKMQ